MSRRNRLFFLLLLLNLLVEATFAQGQQPTLLEGRLRSEGLVAWSNREKEDEDVEMEGILVENMNNLAPQTIRFARLGKQMFLEAKQDSTNPGSVLCVTDTSSFVLARNQIGSPYAITHLGTKDRANVVLRIDSKFPNQMSHLIQKPFGFKLTSLLQPSASGKRGKLKVEPVQRAGKELALVTYVVAGDRPNSKSAPEETIVDLLFDPGHQWVALNGTFRRASQNNTTQSFEYAEDEDGRPTLTKYHWDQAIPNRDGTLGKVFQDWEFTKFSRKPLSPALFTVANFGVPGISSSLEVGVVPRYQYWLLGLAVAFATIAVMARVSRLKSSRV